MRKAPLQSTIAAFLCFSHPAPCLPAADLITGAPLALPLWPCPFGLAPLALQDDVLLHAVLGAKWTEQPRDHIDTLVFMAFDYP